MSHAQVQASVFVEEQHPRAAGGKFGTKSGSTTKPAKKAPAAKTTPKRRGPVRRTIPAGALGFDGVRGTGYGHRGGDPRVKRLQTELNRLGLTDSRGRKLAVDGKLGPLTTQSIKAAQLRLGMRPTGIISPAFIDRLAATRVMPAPRTPVKKAVPRKAAKSRVRAKFNPNQPRDPDGKWGDGIPGASALKDALNLAGRIELDEGETLAGSGRLNLESSSGDDVVWAAIDTSEGRFFRIGGIPDEDVDKWRAADLGGTAELSSESASRLMDDLSAAESKAQDLAGQAEEIWETGEAPSDPVLNGGAPLAQGLVGGEFGAVEWSVYLDDSEPVSWVTNIQFGDDEALDITLDEDDFSALIAALDRIVSTPVTAAAPTKVAAAELRGIELARPGTWNLSSGKLTVTDQHITDAARYANRKGGRPGYVKIGHVDPRFDGEPALGWLHNIRREVDDRGPKLVGDIHDMPDWLAAAAPKAWPDRSMEGWADYTDPETGERYALVVDGVALLGVTPPGMSSIQSLRDLPKAVGVAAASGIRVVASMASAPVAVEEGAGHMDPAITRTALGLAADASDEEVRSALLVAAQSLGGDSGPAQQPVQASLFGEETPDAPKPKAPVVAPGTMVIASSVWDETQKTIKTLTDFVARTKRDERDGVIAQAVKAGKFAPAQRLHFSRLWDADPDGTRALIDSLTPNTGLAVLASGYAGGEAMEEDELDREIARLSRPKEDSRG
jgi:peptidoglycan hydrolase-like protein with peptidoglycan-binding domain